MNALKRRPRPRKSPRTNVQVIQPQPVNPIIITGAVVSTTTLTLTFDQVVRLEGLPGLSVDVIADPVQANQPAPNQVEIVFSADITGATTVNIPFRDPAIRSANGGYVVGTSHVFA